MSDIHTFDMAYDYIINFLRVTCQDEFNSYTDEERSDTLEIYAKTILSDVFEIPFAQLAVKNPILNAHEWNKVLEIVNAFVAGLPLQQATERDSFRYLDFLYINKDVLIPRKETEMLVDIVKFYIQKKEIKEPLIADIGTGSGVIALSLAQEVPNSHIYATDISEPALQCAEENARKFNLQDRIDFENCSSLDKFEYYQHSRNLFDVIVSNPPYIPTLLYEDLKLGDFRFSFEPRIALDGGDDGLDVFREILNKTSHLIAKGGLYAFELHEGSLLKAAKIAKYHNLKSVEIIKDLTGRNRFLTAIK